VKLLAVDDHPRIRSLLKTMLCHADDEWRECVDGAEVMGVFLEFEPDWVLMDVEMPRQDGITATAEILAKYPDAQIIIISQHDDPELQSNAIKAGAQRYVLKSELHTLPEILS
jgi:two-component system response regulator DegU